MLTNEQLNYEDQLAIQQNIYNNQQCKIPRIEAKILTVSFALQLNP